MKNVNFLLISALFVAACGGKKNPVGDTELKTIREDGKKVQEMGPREPVKVTDTKIVVKEVEKIREEATIDEKFIVITPDPQMNFKEGVKSTFQIRARVLVAGTQVKLTAKELPTGATLVASTSEKGLYLLTWTPDYYTIPNTEDSKQFTVKLTAQVESAANPSDMEKLKGLVREQQVTLSVFRKLTPPTDLKISGLPNEVVADTQPTTFTVTVKVPGVDDRAPQKPLLLVTFDGVSYSPGQNFLEADGSRHVMLEPSKKDPEYLGQNTWKFTRVFDAKNVLPQPQLSKDGKLMPDADGTRVRMSFKVYNSYGLSTPEKLVQVKIRYAPKGAGK